MKKCIICVDGGGTKTEVIAFTLDGDEIAKKIGGSGNFSFETEKAVQNVISTTDAVYDLVNGHYQCVYIQMGISGYGAYIPKETLIDDLKKHFNTEVNIVDDAKLALFSILKDQYNEAILVLAGTGSACYGIKDSETLLVGGWGHLLGDEGGAHHLVLQAFKKLIEVEDNGEKPSPFAKKLLQHLNLNNTFDLKKYVYHTSKAELASHAQFINECALLGDEEAIQLLIDSGNHLAKFAYLVYKRLMLSADIVIGCQGSFILNSKIVNQQFKKNIKSLIPQARFVEEEEPPVVGAYYLAKRQLKQLVGDKEC